MKQLRPRKCSCRLKSCNYCKDRDRYERDRNKIMERVKIVRLLQKKREEEIMSMPVDDLIASVRED